MSDVDKFAHEVEEWGGIVVSVTVRSKRKTRTVQQLIQHEHISGMDDKTSFDKWLLDMIREWTVGDFR